MGPHSATAEPVCAADGEQKSGANYVLCMPDGWNGTLLIFAHGYVPPQEPLLTFPPIEDTPLEEVIQQQGYALAASSYSSNGLAVLEGLDDSAELVDLFAEEWEAPERVFIVGASMGGLIATLGAETLPDTFDGALALCGPNGHFRGQVDYFGHFRTVFDYFFPGLMPGSTVEIPPSLVKNWDGFFLTKILPELLDPANGDALDQLFAVTGAAYSENMVFSRIEVVRRLLWYNVIATDDATEKLGGQPFDNSETEYSGSQDDAALNEQIERYSADDDALDAMLDYETSGALAVPLVTMHTTGDPVVPYAQATLYQEKVEEEESDDLFDHFEVERFEHCLFTPEELSLAFERLEELVDEAQ